MSKIHPLEAAGDRGPAITCHPSGRLFYPLMPEEADVRLDDIVHALSHINRFNGHTSTPYSVAQHSYLVASLMEDWILRGAQVSGGRALVKAALLHDAAEAYIGDISSPIKPFVTIAGHLAERVEERILDVIFKALKVGFDSSNLWGMQLIKRFDNQALALEAMSLKGIDPRDWGLELPASPYVAHFYPLEPGPARRIFLAMWDRLNSGG